ncbi:MAG: stage III sporulation protein AF [Oscillospiraceae bacterium]|nr:stage III sporulation protein AF [Oscillospiraceae bacterium]
MDFLRGWILGMAGAATVGVFALAVTPDGAVKRVVRMAASLLLVIAVLRPLAGWDGSALPDLGAWAGESGVAAAAGESLDELLSVIIAEKTAAYIVTKAQALGLTVGVSARCRRGEHTPVPWAVTVTSDRPEHARSALGAMIAKDLGIPAERQTYVQKGGGP